LSFTAQRIPLRDAKDLGAFSANPSRTLISVKEVGLAFGTRYRVRSGGMVIATPHSKLQAGLADHDGGNSPSAAKERRRRK